MAEVTIPKEKMNYTIDLLITMVTDEIAEETGKDRKEILSLIHIFPYQIYEKDGMGYAKEDTFRICGFTECSDLNKEKKMRCV